MADWEDDLYRQQVQAAQNAYNKAQETAKSIYDSGAGVANKTANSAIGQQNKTTDSGLADAYVGRMLDERNIGQRLAAMGYNGGASETALLGIGNNYRSNRAGLEAERLRANNATELQRASDLAGLWQAYQQSLNSAFDTYSGRLADYQNAAYQREQARQAQAAAAAAAAATQASSNTGTATPKQQQPKNNGDVMEDVRQLLLKGYGKNAVNSYLANYTGVDAATRNNIVNSISWGSGIG